jgi:hypothetical protein
VAQRTLDEYLEDVTELVDMSREYERMPKGAPRNLMHMIHLHAAKMQAEMEKGAYQRKKSREYKAKKRRLSTGADVPLWGE